MKISLKKIGGKGADLHETFSPEELDLPEEIVICLSPITVDVHVERAGDEVIADCQLSGKYRMTCGHCLEEFDFEKTDRFRIVIDVEAETDVIDLTDDIRQELIIAMPSNPVCRPECKGLCPGCGENLNVNKCTCKKADGI